MVVEHKCYMKVASIARQEIEWRFIDTGWKIAGLPTGVAWGSNSGIVDSVFEILNHGRVVHTSFT